jgi:hypothetical protein
MSRGVVQQPMRAPASSPCGLRMTMTWSTPAIFQIGVMPSQVKSRLAMAVDAVDGAEAPQGEGRRGRDLLGLGRGAGFGGGHLFGGGGVRHGRLSITPRPPRLSRQCSS